MDKKDRALNILVQVHNSYAKKNLVISRNETMDNYLDLRVLQPLQYRKEAVELFVNLFFTKIDDFNADKSFKYHNISLNTLINASIFITYLVKETINILNKSPKSWLFLDNNEIRNITMNKSNYLSSRYIKLINKFDILIFADCSATDYIDNEVDVIDINILKEITPFLKYTDSFTFNDFKEIIKNIDYKNVNVYETIKTLHTINNSNSYFISELSNCTSFTLEKFELNYLYLLLDLEMHEEIGNALNYLSNKFGITLNITSIEQVLYESLILDRSPIIYSFNERINDEELLRNIKTAIQKRTRGYNKFKSNILKSIKCENYYRQIDGRYVKVTKPNNLIYIYMLNCKTSILNKALELLIQENLKDSKDSVCYYNYRIISYSESYNNLIIQKINTAFLHFLKPEQRTHNNLPFIKIEKS